MTPAQSKRMRTSAALKPVHRLAALCLFSAGLAIGQQAVDPLAQQRAMAAVGELGKSEESLRTYLKDHPTSADAHFLLGYVLFREEKAIESLAEFTTGARFKTPTADELKTVASDYVLLHAYSEADKWFTAVVAQKPNDADGWYLLGRTKYHESAFKDAISSFEKALALQPKFIEAENNLGLSWRELNNTEKAKAAFETAISWQTDSPLDPQPFLNLGTLLAEENQLEKARESLERAAAISPGNPKIHEELGHVYEASNQLAKAQAELEQATKLAPTIPSLHFKLGQIYRREGLVERAKQEFAQCEYLNSTHSFPNTPNPPGAKDSGPR